MTTIMASAKNIFLFVCSLIPYYTLSFPLCTNSRAPFELKAPLKFCQYNGTACCNSAEDFKLQSQFDTLNISDPQCASLMKSILCGKCDQYSSQLFTLDAGLRRIPILCNSTESVDFCTKVWDACKDIAISNSPFSPLGQGRLGTPSHPSPFKLIDGWKSKQDFCEAHGGSPDDKTICFDGKSAAFSTSKGQPSVKGICIEKIATGSYFSLAPHPDGSDHAFLASQEGKIWLAVVPMQGSSRILSINAKPFLDISDQVLLQTKYGLFSMAFHPEFTKNGRLFVSFNCDKLQHLRCSGRCSCNPDAKCDPASLPTDNGVTPCQIHNVIAEYSVNRVASKPSYEEIANPSEVRRILTMGLPSTKGHAGQILFGPADGYMYVVSPFETKDYDKHNFIQNKKSILGKILRLDVNKIPSEAEANNKNLWGNYSIPEENPYMDDKELLPEIWALGLRNPWRCSFDAERPSYFMCGESGQDLYEEVDIITKGGNYGWPIYEGLSLSHAGGSQKANTSPSSINPIFPVLVYTRFNAGGGASSITGGYFYRSMTDPCLYGRYLYADLYADAIWVAAELPQNSGNFTSEKMPFTCAKDSPLECNKMPQSSAAAIGYLFSFGEDNRKDVYILTSTGVYRIVHPSRCGFSCSEKNQSGVVSQGPPLSSSGYKRKLVLLDYLLYWFVTYAGFIITVL